MKRLFLLICFLPFIGAIDIDQCQSLNESGGQYVLNQSISSETSCIEINNESITFDCKGFQINAVTSGILVNDFDNVTIKNCEILGATSASIAWADAGNTLSQFTIDNITTPSSPAYGLYLDKSLFGGVLNYTRVINSNMAAIQISDQETGGFPYGDVINTTLTSTAYTNGGFDASSVYFLENWNFYNDIINQGGASASISYQNDLGGTTRFLKFVDSYINGKIDHFGTGGLKSSRIYLINTSYSLWDYTAENSGSSSYLFVESYLVVNASNSTDGIANILATVYDDVDAFLTNGTTDSNGILVLPVLNWYIHSGNFYSPSTIDITPLSGLFEDLVVPGQKVEILLNASWTNTTVINFNNSGTPPIFLNFEFADEIPEATPTPTPAAIIQGGGSPAAYCGDTICSANENSDSCPIDCPKLILGPVSGLFPIKITSKYADKIDLIIIAIFLIWLFTRKQKRSEYG